MTSPVAETGAVITGKRTFEMGDPDSYVGNYEFQVPRFVVTHHPPAKPPAQDEHLTFTFIREGPESAVEQAKAAAAGKGIQVVGGVDLTRQLLVLGLVDELRVDIMPVLLGRGIRLFDSPAFASIRLEKIGVEEVDARTASLSES